MCTIVHTINLYLLHYMQTPVRQSPSYILHTISLYHKVLEVAFEFITED